MQDTLINQCTGVESGTFKLKAGVSEAQLREVAQEVEQGFLCDEPGFIAHLVLKETDDQYADITLAETPQQVEAICNKWLENPLAQRYLALVDPDSVKLSFWTRIK